VRLSLVFYAFLARMAVGIAIALIVVWRVRAAERHLRFETLLAFVLAAGAAALYDPALGDAYPGVPRGWDAFLSFEGALPGALVVFAVACLAVNFLFGTFRRRAGRAALLLAVGVGLVAVYGTTRFSGLALAPAATTTLFVSGLLGGLVMASINDAMVLGHFYLMIKGLPLEALRRAGLFVFWVLAARILVFAGVLLFWDGASEVLLERELIWTAWRVAFGFLGPLVLLLMVKDTVRLKHTQAATGLLYVAVGFALMGELAAVYLEIQTGLPA
jgi:hypothetical protein